MPLEQHLEDARVGLHHPLVAGNDDCLEPRQELEALSQRREGLRRPIGDRVQRHAPAFQLRKHLDRAIDGAGDHLVEALAERLDQLDLVGMVRQQLLCRLGKASARVLPLVPFRRADSGEEMLHRCVVAIEELPIQKSRVPLEQHTAETLKSLAVTTIKSIRQTVATLSGGQRQSVAVARAVMWNSKLVILDEPTAALGVAQTEQVLALVKRLAEQGLAVVLISHNLHDVFEVSHRITVLRLGRTVGVYERDKTTQEEVVHAITAGAPTKVSGIQGTGAEVVV